MARTSGLAAHRHRLRLLRPTRPVAEALALFIARAARRGAWFQLVSAVLATPAARPPSARHRRSIKSPQVASGWLSADPTSAGCASWSIYCHPVAESFAAAAHASCASKHWPSGGHEVTDVDLYAENFDPVMSRQDRLDYLNTDAQRAPGPAIRRSARLGGGHRAGLSGVVVRHAGDAEGLFRSRLAAGRRVRRDARRHGSDRAPEAHPAYRRGHDLWRLVVDGAPRHRRPGAQGDLPRGAGTVRARSAAWTWFVHYNMDQAKPRELSRFLDRVRRGIARLG